MTLLVRWKKLVRSVITSDPEDVDGAEDISNNTHLAKIHESVLYKITIDLLYLCDIFL